MEDIFVEQLIRRKKTEKDVWTSVLLVIGGIIFTPMALYFGFALHYLGYVFLIMLAAMWWCVVRLIKSKTVEYEYVFTDGTLDIDMIIAGSRRGRVITVSKMEFELVAPVSHPYSGEYKTLNCSTKDENDRLYYIMTERHGVGKVRVLFNPNDELLEAIKLSRPSIVITGE
ncbi:MAG: hypothetical protein IJY55_05070 [Clostridia bacterium]|nr:hypothetical protein [Clostridia bacterium]